VLSASDSHDQAARLLMPQAAGDRDLVAVGRALNRLGLGPVVANGVKSLELRAAIVKFQRLKHLPVTGEADPAVIAALKADAGVALR
jgi:peptidoglycan hydrolase-like protein with peptidoglycan-binding domain